MQKHSGRNFRKAKVCDEVFHHALLRIRGNHCQRLSVFAEVPITVYQTVCEGQPRSVASQVFPETELSLNRTPQMGVSGFELIDVNLAIRPLAMNRRQLDPLQASIKGMNPNPTLNGGDFNESEKTQLTKEIIRHNVLQ
jgi:hypothetical protein